MLFSVSEGFSTGFSGDEEYGLSSYPLHFTTRDVSADLITIVSSNFCMYNLLEATMAVSQVFSAALAREKTVLEWDTTSFLQSSSRG